ncbi:DUF599 domain-containing protein [Psychrobium sp. 1_MG-2023]|uniref:DUF599 domain-containing protein n=1 Tax=Psychrobium sp. 1_MG-2023 TaxID=3062624 RepID=UPI002681D0EB|nr:DUF599 domain-containing protein [Psychrobium sp. 1_MG-2023]MDP2559604.1 DUF599 domain-containing protein [Psychrobium sp. 1_MG-2023]
MDVNLISIAGFVWFIFCWFGYTTFARKQAKKRRCIASVLHRYRIAWMRRLLFREQLIADTALLASLERQVTFFASTTILILAALLTLLSTSERLFELISDIPGVYQASIFDIQVHLIVMIAIFIYAFFTFTWSMRQYGFCSVLMGAFPRANSEDDISAEHENYIRHVAKIIDHAGHSYNYGLRSYYFAMSTLAWFIHPIAFIFATTMVVMVLYQREFHSQTLRVMDQIDS